MKLVKMVFVNVTQIAIYINRYSEAKKSIATEYSEL